MEGGKEVGREGKEGGKGGKKGVCSINNEVGVQ